MKALCTSRYRRSVIRHPQSGQSLLELAFLVPVLLLLALGVIEVGRYAYIAILVGNAAHAGAIYGSQSLPQSNDPLIVTAARNDFKSNGQLASSLAVTYFATCGCDSSGTVATAACTGVGAGTCASGHWVVLLSVTASGTFSSLFNYPGIPASITVSRISTMRVAQI
jgi:Flp pilus assembly protein TadG